MAPVAFGAVPGGCWRRPDGACPTAALSCVFGTGSSENRSKIGKPRR